MRKFISVILAMGMTAMLLSGCGGSSAPAAPAAPAEEKAEAEARNNQASAAQATLYSLVSERDSAYEKSSKTGDALLKEIHENMLNKALERREKMTHTAHDLEEMKEIAATKPGFIRAMWCGEEACELQLKEEADISSRCMPFEDQEQVETTCVCCGKPATKLVYWGKAY